MKGNDVDFVLAKGHHGSEIVERFHAGNIFDLFVCF